jgi:hypothetical protein
MRKLNGPLTHHQVGDILDAQHEARKAGMPLTVHITQRPPGADALSPSQRMEILQATINAYCTFARRHMFLSCFLWIREVEPDGTGEHFHILVHVPAKLVGTFRERAEARRSFPEIKVTQARERLWQLSDGRWCSTATYIAKQMTPQARYKFRIPCKKGGKVWGARMGMSRILRALLKD